MSANNSNAIVVHSEENSAGATASSSSTGVVLDALPYVEALDPNYEQYAVSLIEEELQHVVTEHHHQQLQRGDASSNELGEHPSLQTLLPASSSYYAGNNHIASNTPDFGGHAPMAKAAYEELAAQRASGNDNAPITTPFAITRPDPMAESDTDNMDEATLISNLQTSIATSKIKLEQERIRLVNLELHQNFDTPARFTEYASQLETQYLNTTQTSVENQRRVVDGINATRMEEQTQSIDKLHGMMNRYDSLVDKNRRLGKALEGLEGEVASLREVANKKEGTGGEGGEVGMEVAEASKES